MKRTVVAAGLMGITLLTMASGCGTTKSTATPAGTASPASTATPADTTPTTPAPTAPPTTPAPTAPPTTPAPTAPPTTLSLQEQNAIQAAQQYLSMGSGYSQAGLIQQLSSSAGDGYPLAIATAAVDSLNVNWNAQAVLAAKGYLQMSPFSCSGMVQQLDSSAGSQFTAAQAQYGATAVGLC
jgi:hypothetical protein